MEFLTQRVVALVDCPQLVGSCISISSKRRGSDQVIPSLQRRVKRPRGIVEVECPPGILDVDERQFLLLVNTGSTCYF